MTQSQTSVAQLQRRVDPQFILDSGTIQGLILGVFGQNLNKLQNKSRSRGDSDPDNGGILHQCIVLTGDHSVIRVWDGDEAPGITLTL